MNWTGIGVDFCRSDWLKVRNRPEFQRTGIYILVGYKQPDDDLPRSCPYGWCTPVKQIEPYGETGKFKLVLSEPAKPIAPIPYGAASSGAMRGPRYTTLDRLNSAATIGELLAK